MLSKQDNFLRNELSFQWSQSDIKQTCFHIAIFLPQLITFLNPNVLDLLKIKLYICRA